MTALLSLIGVPTDEGAAVINHESAIRNLSKALLDAAEQILEARVGAQAVEARVDLH